MKKLLLFTIAIITVFSCSSDGDEEFQPNLSFNIESGSRVASSTITATNTTTNQNGGYIWEVISNSGTQIFTTQNLSFKANKIGDYTIRLKSNQFDLQIEQTITTTRPTFLKFDKLSLKDIPQSYSSLYFKILRGTLTGASTYTYTSPTRQNISNAVPSATTWNVDFPGNTITITDETNDSATYLVEFYDGNDNLVTRLNGFTNIYFDFSEFVAGEEEFTTSSFCTNCDYFEAVLDFSFQ